MSCVCKLNANCSWCCRIFKVLFVLFLGTHSVNERQYKGMPTHGIGRWKYLLPKQAVRLQVENNHAHFILKTSYHQSVLTELFSVRLLAYLWFPEWILNCLQDRVNWRHCLALCCFVACSRGKRRTSTRWNGSCLRQIQRTALWMWTCQDMTWLSWNITPSTSITSATGLASK